MTWIKKHWGWIVTMAAGACTFLDPSVQAYAAAHSQSTVIVTTLWGVAMAWARSPRS